LSLEIAVSRSLGERQRVEDDRKAVTRVLERSARPATIKHDIPTVPATPTATPTANQITGHMFGYPFQD